MRRGLILLSLALVAGLSACTEMPAKMEVTSPPSRPAGLAPRPAPEPPAPAAIAAPSTSSADSAARYARLERNLLIRGLLRRDGGGPDTPFGADDVARNFLQIALYDEYVTRGGNLQSQPTETRLRRWDKPVRLAVEFGPSVSADTRVRVTNEVGAYARRLSRISGLSISMAETEHANYRVLFLNEDERRAIGPRLRSLAPSLQPAIERSIVGMPPSTLCAVVAFADGAGYSYGQAIAVIRAEHPDLLRLSCIHEELAQGLGLVNDSPRARPSIFNDDEEFALLTSHDELLLRILYDPRLKSGMTLAESRPLVRQIAREVLGGES